MNKKASLLKVYADILVLFVKNHRSTSGGKNRLRGEKTFF